MVLLFWLPHTQQPSRRTRSSYLSPTSPQLWIKPVNKPVNNPRYSVRFVKNVRLSPFVDHLWTRQDPHRSEHHCHCGHHLASCARSGPLTSLSPTIHEHGSWLPTHPPQMKTRALRGIQAFIHTFPKPYDDDYRDRSMNPHTNNDKPAVDVSRTLSTLSRSTGGDNTASTHHTTFEGGHE